VAEPDKAQEVTADATTANEIDWEQWLDSYNSSAPMPGGIKRDGEDLPTLEQTLTKAETLFDHLTWQLSVSNLVEDDLKIAYEIVGSLDDSGFLPGDMPLEDIAIRLTEREKAEHAFLKKPGTPTIFRVEHVERVLGRVQELDPVGVAARSLEECLLIQLKYHGHKNPLVERMITEFMSDLEKRNFAAIAKKAEVTIEEVGEAMKIIQTLDPRPARNFGEEKSIYITPDIYVHKVGEEYVIVSNEDGLPMLKISKYYKAALSNGMNAEAKAYVNEKLRSAKWLIESIQRRQRTIYKVMESILKFQREFFDKGIEHLKSAHPARRGRRHRHARVHHLPGHFQQVRAHATGHLRAEVLLQQLDRPQRRRRRRRQHRRQESHQAHHRRGGSQAAPVRPSDRRDPGQGEHRDRPAYCGEIPREPGNPGFIEAQEDPLTMGLRGARAGDRPERRSPRGESE
jgi:RNA polymerase sigma-54 factor